MKLEINGITLKPRAVENKAAFNYLCGVLEQLAMKHTVMSVEGAGGGYKVTFINYQGIKKEYEGLELTAGAFFSITRKLGEDLAKRHDVDSLLRANIKKAGMKWFNKYLSIKLHEIGAMSKDIMEKHQNPTYMPNRI